MRTTIVLPAIAFSALTFAACGGGGGDDDGASADPVDARAELDARPPDAGPIVDAAPAPCTAPASFGDVGALEAQAFFVPDVNEGTDDGATDDLLVLFAPLETSEMPDAIQLQLFAGYGAFAGGAIRTGTFELTGVELDLLACGICAGVITDTTQDGYADDYLPTGGTLELTAVGTAVGQMLTGRLSNLTFRRMTIAEDGSTTPDGDCATMLTAATFSATLMMDPGGGKGR